jgi:hypothetical protein
MRQKDTEFWTELYMSVPRGSGEGLPFDFWTYSVAFYSEQNTALWELNIFPSSPLHLWKKTYIFECSRRNARRCRKSRNLVILTELCMLSRDRDSVTNSKGFWIGWLDLLTTSSCLQQYSAIVDLHNLQFIITHALGFSVSTSRTLVTELKQTHCD